jgi:hypothetical protein
VEAATPDISIGAMEKERNETKEKGGKGKGASVENFRTRSR